MKASTVVAGLVAAAAPVLAQRPMNTSICDYYTTALLTQNTAANQLTVLTLVVNTAVIGRYSNLSHSDVAGILAPGMVNGTAVNLAPYFSGALRSSNRNGQATAVNFLDGGGAAPLMMNMAANNTDSNQYRLLNHLYQYFGALLGCSATDYPAYMGAPSMAQVHKFMDLTPAENTWFIQQVGASALSFGVTQADVTIVANTLLQTFNYRCAPATTIIPSQGAQLQSICTNSACELAPNSTCDAYQGFGVTPMNATSGTATTTSGGASATTSAGGSSTSRPATTTAAGATPTPGAANKATYGMGAGLLALAALAL